MGTESVRAWSATKLTKTSASRDGLYDIGSITTVTVLAETEEEAVEKLKMRGCSESSIANMVEVSIESSEVTDAASANYGQRG